MRYPASEKLEIIRAVETSPLPVRRTLAQIGIAKSTFYACSRMGGSRLSLVAGSTSVRGSCLNIDIVER